MVDEPADEADHDVGRSGSGWRPEGWSFHGAGECGQAYK